jgi:hypothetical protein
MLRAPSSETRTTFVVAHRAGNDLGRLEIASTLELPLAEADVHLYRGRLEVRHLKTAGPLPLLWDRWALAPRWTPRLELDSLLAAAADAAPELMLDLKGHDARLSERVAGALAGFDRRVTVCSQDWRLLDPFADVPGVRVVHSVGGIRALRRLPRQRRLDGISIHRGLLDAATVHALRSIADTIMSWPVESLAEARRLSALGVDGLISQAFEPIATALTAEAALA